VNISLVHDSLGRSKGGIEAWLYHAGDCLRRAGHRPHAIAVDQTERRGDAMPAGIPVSWLKRRSRCSIIQSLINPSNSMWLTGTARELQLVCNQADVFWSRSFWGTLAATNIACGRRVVYIQATPLPVYLRLARENVATQATSPVEDITVSCRRAAYGRLERKAMEQASCLVYLSRSRMEETLSYYGEAFRPKCKVVPPGVDLERSSALAKSCPVTLG
jgi:hypothetical protein